MLGLTLANLQRPYHLVVRSNPPSSDMRTISAIFKGELITAGYGKLYVIDPVFSIDCGGLGNSFLTQHFLHVKRFVMQPSFPG